jgi:hypothetical protein
MAMLRRILMLGTVLAVAGCAHSITLTPDNHALAGNGLQPIKRNVGYYISDENKSREFTTPGGGGDKVSHYPYRDIGPGFYTVLSNVFEDVTVLKAANDTETIRKKNISLVFLPTFVPASDSDSVLTWPPTRFTLILECVVYDADGKQIARKSVLGTGAASYDEFKQNFGLAGQRASTDALQKLQVELSNSPEFK